MENLDKDFADPPELRHQIEKAMNGLTVVTAAHQGTWHIGEAAWSVDLNAGMIVFTTPHGMRAEAPVQIIGTYNTEDGTWLWGWDHPSVLPAVGEHARQMLQYGQERGFARLTTLTFPCTEQTCWELTALAFQVCKANGAYRGPAGAALVFMTFGQIKLTLTNPLRVFLLASANRAKPFAHNTYESCTILVQIGPIKSFRMNTSVNL